MHADLDHVAAAQLQLADQFDANGAAGRDELNAVQQRAANEAIVAIDVANADAEKQPRAEVVYVTDPDPMRRIVALELVAVHQSGLRRDPFEQQRQLADIVLSIAIGIENELLCGRGESAAQRAAIAAIARVGYDAEPWAMHPLQLFEDFGGVVVTAVVDYDHFVVRHVIAQHLECPADQRRKRRRVVISRKEQAERSEPLRHGYTIFSPMKISDWPAGKPCPAPIHAASMASAEYSKRSSHGATFSTPLAAGWRVRGSQMRNLASATGISSEFA